jgi:hypothetical protein
MAITQIGPSEMARLRTLIYDGMQTQAEIESLKQSIKDTIDCVSEELNIPTALLKKAIQVAHKGSFKDVSQETMDLETILKAAGQLQTTP